MGNMTPFFAFNQFKVDDKKNDANKVIEINTAGKTDNNLTDIAFGIETGKHTDQFRPRLTVSMKSGKWNDNEKKEETRSQMDITLAVYGHM